MELNVNNFFRYYIFHYNAEELTKKEQSNAKIMSIVLRALTLGLMHLICQFALYDRSFKIKKTSDEPKTSKMSQEILNTTKDSSPTKDSSSTEDSSMKLGSKFVDEFTMSSKENDSKGVAEESFKAKNHSSFIFNDAIEKILIHVGDILDKHNVSKIKIFIKCKIVDYKQDFEFDLFEKEGFVKSSILKESIEDKLNKVKKWLVELFEIPEFDGSIKVFGQAYCLGEDSVYHVHWDEGYKSTKDYLFNGSSGFSLETSLDKEHLNGLLEHYLNEFNIKIPRKIESPTDFFEKNIISTSISDLKTHFQTSQEKTGSEKRKRGQKRGQA